MLRAALLLSVALCATPALAQQRESCTGGPGVTAGEYIEARRPVIAKRKLTGEERAEANRLTGEVRAALKTMSKKENERVRPAHATLDKLAIYGASGDREIMKTLMEGYAEAPGVKVTDNLMPGETWGISTTLAGLWATHVWRDGDKSKPTSKALANCLGPEAYGKVQSVCGFEADFGKEIGQNTFSDHWTGKKGSGPKTVTFTEAKITQTPEEEQTRFKVAYERYVGGSQEQPDRGWAYCWAKRQGPKMVAAWDSKSGLASTNYTASIKNEADRKQAEIDRKAAEWTALQARRVEAKAIKAELPDADYGKWVGLSFWLGGKYLEPYASEVYLQQETAIDSLCRAKPGAVCDRQRQILARLGQEARDEALSRELALRNLTLGPSSTTVRTYDQNGNFLGTTSMPKWQADILAGD